MTRHCEYGQAIMVKVYLLNRLHLIVFCLRSLLSRVLQTSYLRTEQKSPAGLEKPQTTGFKYV